MSIFKLPLSINRYLSILITAIIAMLILPRTAAQTATSLQPAPPAQTTPQAFQEIEKAIQAAIAAHQQSIPLLILYKTQIDHIQIADDGMWATAWLTPLDSENENPIPIEPGIAIVRQELGRWTAILPSDPGWISAAWAAPANILPAEVKAVPLADMASSSLASASAPYSGYYLPWAGGETMALTQSVGHDRYTPSGNAHFAFDFAKPGYPSGMFDVYASRNGTVKQAVWSHENGNESLANYIVLEDTSTSPTTYQLYLHFAKDSIPAALRVVGAQVLQGQFIGVADDTGISSGNHLHFMVHTNPASYWGTSVDITFADVAINGGRPRIPSDLAYCDESDVCEETQYYYISGNFASDDSTPPVGGITLPNHAATVQSTPLHMQGWASDEGVGLSTAQFLAAYNGVWQPVGGQFSSAQFELDWDFCNPPVPDGPVSLALELWDKVLNKSPNLPGLIHFTKNYQCPITTQTCLPGANQVALFADGDYQGDCVQLGVGSYTATGDLADDADSIKVGDNVLATLFLNSAFDGRGESFTYNDSNLSDNRIGANTVSSVRVQSRSTTPAPPAPVWPADNAIFTQDESFSLVWEETGGGTQYQARLQPEIGDPLVTTWQSSIAWHLNGLGPGDYTWQVKARNGSAESAWSSAQNLQIQASAAGAAAAQSAPFEDTMENTPTQWTPSSAWEMSTESNHTPGGAYSWKYETDSPSGYDTGLPNGGHLTSPAIDLPENGEYYLRFWYRYETESPGLHWDQRWVQISVDGGQFTNLLQLYNDPMNYWLRSPAISLANYAGQTVRVRFYFGTLDSAFNNFIGLYLDDFSITTDAPPDCADQNNAFTQAQLVAYGSQTDGLICPGGDLDFYKFHAIAGDKIGAYITAQKNGSALDSYLFLLDVNGGSVLAENDDIVPGQKTDSWLNYRLTRTGTYYLMVRSWNHPTAGGTDNTYALHLVKDDQDPTAQFIYPIDHGGIVREPVDLLLSASDAGSGVSHVQFLWHTSDWQNSDWIVLGEDWDPQDGWSFPFDAGAQPANDIAFYTRVYDWAGNWIGTGAWFIGPPLTYLPLIFK